MALFTRSVLLLTSLSLASAFRLKHQPSTVSKRSSDSDDKYSLQISLRESSNHSLEPIPMQMTLPPCRPTQGCPTCEDWLCDPIDLALPEQCPGLAKRFTSNWKRFFQMCDGQHLLAVAKNGRAGADIQKEYQVLNTIRDQGLRAVEASVVHVTEESQVRQGLFMTFLSGSFVDVYKWQPQFSGPAMLLGVLHGGEKKYKEFNVYKAEDDWYEFVEDVGNRTLDFVALRTFEGDVQKIVEAYNRNFHIKDLQVIVNGAGEVTIIDPLAAGNYSTRMLIAHNNAEAMVKYDFRNSFTALVWALKCAKLLLAFESSPHDLDEFVRGCGDLDEIPVAGAGNSSSSESESE